MMEYCSNPEDNRKRVEELHALPLSHHSTVSLFHFFDQVFASGLFLDKSI